MPRRAREPFAPPTGLSRLEDDLLAARVLMAQSVAMTRAGAKAVAGGRTSRATLRFGQSAALRRVALRLCRAHKRDLADVMRVPVGRGGGSPDAETAEVPATAEDEILAKATELDLDALAAWMKEAKPGGF